MKRITVLLAEDHTIVREGFRKMLELEGDFQIVGEAQDGREAVALAKKLRPSVVLMDIAMPRLNGLEATRQLHKALPGTRVLVLSAHSDDAYIEDATEESMNKKHARGPDVKNRDLVFARNRFDYVPARNRIRRDAGTFDLRAA